VYQTGLLQLAEFEHRTREVDERRRRLVTERDELTAQRQELIKDNRLRQRVDSLPSALQRTWTIWISLSASSCCD
jgi:hypothetical protein